MFFFFFGLEFGDVFFFSASHVFELFLSWLLILYEASEVSADSPDSEIKVLWRNIHWILPPNTSGRDEG